MTVGDLLRRSIGMAIVASFPPFSGHAQFVPPAGYSGQGTQPSVVVPTDADAPLLTRIPDESMARLFQVDLGYRRGAARGSVKVVGAFEVSETAKRRLVAAWSLGFPPVTLMFSDGQCYSLQADYTGGRLSNGRLNNVGCDTRRMITETPPPAPQGSALRLIGSAWTYVAWASESTATTIVTAPFSTAFRPLFTARMATVAIMAMNGPDFPGGNVTLVGRLGGRLAVITLEVGY